MWSTDSQKQILLSSKILVSRTLIVHQGLLAIMEYLQAAQTEQRNGEFIHML